MIFKIPFTYLVALAFLLFILFCHFTAVAHLDINNRGICSDGEMSTKDKIWILCCWLGYWVFLNYRWLTRVGNYLSDLHKKYYYIIYPAKIIILVLYLVLFAFYLHNVFRIVTYVFLFVTMAMISFYRFEYVSWPWVFLVFFYLIVYSTCLSWFDSKWMKMLSAKLKWLNCCRKSKKDKPDENIIDQNDINQNQNNKNYGLKNKLFKTWAYNNLKIVDALIFVFKLSRVWLSINSKGDCICTVYHNHY